ncbi:hypothetical protein ACFWBN_22105 [Streptomyces sp. NPDC059989]|uniref:hypothetical protein n=1 Tax=Streptomyces sp. NPDC059989 TaxID=3347026 RepID=UPI0036872213
MNPTMADLLENLLDRLLADHHIEAGTNEPTPYVRVKNPGTKSFVYVNAPGKVDLLLEPHDADEYIATGYAEAQQNTMGYRVTVQLKNVVSVLVAAELAHIAADKQRA